MINVPWIFLGVGTWPLIVVDVCALMFVFGWFCEIFRAVRWRSWCKCCTAMWTAVSIGNRSISGHNSKVACLDSSVGRASDWRSEGPVFDSQSRQSNHFIFHLISSLLDISYTHQPRYTTSHQTCSWWSETDTKERGVIAMSCYTLQALNLIKVNQHSTSHLGECQDKRKGLDSLVQNRIL